MSRYSETCIRETAPSAQGSKSGFSCLYREKLLATKITAPIDLTAPD